MFNNNLILKNPKIYIFCFSFKKDKDIEAIKKEARTYYQTYKSIDNRVDFKFISLEEELGDNVEKYEEQYDIYYWGMNFGGLLQKEKPDIIHIFADSLDGYYLFEKSYSPSSFVTLYTITGMVGLNKYDEGYLIHLRHAIDVGNLYLFVESTFVKEAFEQVGLQAHIMLPKLKNGLVKSQQTRSGDKCFTIGFASSPLSKDIWEDRGIYLLVSVAKQLSDYKFKLAWRYEGYQEMVDLCRESNVNNVEIHNGFLDMEKFYDDIDVMIAPYTSNNNNHSCPLSIVESVLYGIPVLVSEYVGLKDIITSYEIGVVSKSDSAEMVAKLKKIEENYNYYKLNADRYGKELFDINNFENNNYLKIYNELISQMPSPTLKEWQEELDANGKYLVMDRIGMAEYYNDSFIAQNYDVSRFSEFPMRTYDKLERMAVNLLIKRFSQKSFGENEILDIASGDGRILQALLGFGEITAVENSSFMIATSVKKLSGTVCYVKNDFFNFMTDKKYDIITVFRFIRHFNYNDRKILYKKLNDFLEEGGIILADFPNTSAETQLRSSLKWASFNVYDVFWHLFELINELNDNGFEILDHISVGEYLNAGKIPDQLALSRIVCFRKKQAVII
ncbi:glycosyltransferase involved in cell wall biosynthesis [Fontibacillus phaseoli]|uniref:Glycosyltransferase involved in cell wall biosynthesis n=1 Tax=Fontibacillus phaseoli TaxID=1416533 RepID=A0A369BBW7_9BACL|nr:methyltransferase domain-containing protein [Fontibacillus phaseoli]RCX19019.1 glycosyltransferase involved in cell wall biosynthesis [Fontibacillus phaseoli]